MIIDHVQFSILIELNLSTGNDVVREKREVIISF